MSELKPVRGRDRWASKARELSRAAGDREARKAQAVPRDGWVPLTLMSGLDLLGGGIAPALFLRRDGLVVLHGLIHVNSSANFSGTMFNLPQNVWPAYQYVFTPFAQQPLVSNPQPVTVTANTDGTFTTPGFTADTLVPLDGLCYRVGT